MSYLTVTGIVTRAVNYKDNDRMLTIFSREEGRIDARARGCRRTKSPLLLASQTLIFAEFHLYKSPQDRYIVDNADVLESFLPLREDVERLTAASTMLTLANKSVQKSEANEELFTLIYHGLSFLAYGESHPVDVLIATLLKGLSYIGYEPMIVKCGHCAKDVRKEKKLHFSPKAGGVLCSNCGFYEKEIKPISLEAMRRILNVNMEDMQKVVLPIYVREEILTHLLPYMEYVLEGEQKSLGMLLSMAREYD